MAPDHQLCRSATATLFAVAVALAAACSSAPGPADSGAASPTSATADASAAATVATVTPTTVPVGGYQVRSRTRTLVDDTRPTPDLPDTGVQPAADRTLVTTFTYPDAVGPFPLIVFAHGHNGHPRKFTELFAAWAAAGFVVAAPAFPLSNDEVPGATSVFDLVNQPGDVSFVITSTLQLSGDPDSFLQGRVNPEQIAVGGLSLGGDTVYQVAFDECCRDDRVDAVIVMDGPHPDSDGLDLDRGVPLLIMHADADPVIAYRFAEEAFAAAGPPKYLVTIHEAVHSSPYEDAPDPADQMVIDTTIAFWRLHVAHQADAAADLSTAARVDGLTTVVEQPG